jgi:hypothetical protein
MTTASAELLALAEAWANAAEQNGLARCNYATSGVAERLGVTNARAAFEAALTRVPPAADGGAVDQHRARSAAPARGPQEGE